MKTSDFVRQKSIAINFCSNNNWIILSPIEQEINRKINTYGTPLKEWNIKINFGIKTGFNDAFIIDSKIKDRLVLQDSKSAELIRPILRGRDISRYGYLFADKWLICTFPSREYNIDDYPAVKEYLLSFTKEKLEQSGKTYNINGTIIKSRKKTTNKWFETQDSISYWDEFSKQKIVWKRIGSLLKFAYDDSGSVTLDSTCIATGKNIKYLAAILNTTLGNYLFINSPKTGTGDLIISVQAFEPIKIPQISENEMQKFEELYDCIKLCIDKGEDYSKYELELENKTYQLYDINDIERKYIEKTSRNLFR